MAFDYLNEAFKRLDLLEESMFDSSSEGIDNMSAFLDDDDETIRVIDPEVEDEEDLKDSYVGKVIVNCNICHSHIFEDKEEITIDEDGLVNVEKSCPYCGEQEGFTIIGEIAPYGEPAPEDSSEEAPVSDVEEVNNESEPLEEALGLGAGLALGGAAIGAGMVGSALLDDVNDDDSDDVLTEEPEMSTASKRALKEDTTDEPLLTEDFKEVSITTDDQHMEMTSDENGKITVTTEPIAEDTPSAEEEMIVPVSDETTDEIIANNDDSSEEEPIEDLEFDFDDIDETGMDELGESYLKRVYENVDSFKTTSVGANSSAIIVEGVIKFNSGVQKKTGFVFEAKDANARGQLRFTGSNKHLCESTDAFTLVGRVDNKKLFVESLKYNYKVNDNAVRGIVRRK